jgi:membrane protease YdiL (CAAX protease family)
LTAKASTLRRSLLLVAAPLVLVLLAGYWHRDWLPELGFRVVTSIAAVAVYATAAGYVAFLTAGLGSTRPRGGVLGSLESFLLAVPFAGVLFAPGLPSALLSLSTLGALTFEARRAALSTIDWLDDAEREHGTEVWQALVAFGGFQGAQLLVQQLAGVLAGALPTTLQLLIAYASGAALLWAVTVREQPTPPPARPKLAGLGLVAGALSSGFAWLYLRWLHPTSPEGAGFAASTGLELAIVVLTVSCVAPLVEERFFRGWLQLALERALGSKRAWAPMLTALAFAAAHPARSFLPVLVLGLINGALMLRWRSLSACMVAHAVHNAMALVWAARG